MSMPSFASNSTLPKYIQVTRWLNDALLRHEFKAGDQLPGESSLAKRFQVSTITIRQAFQELTRQGRLIRYPYRGTFVAHTAEAQPDPIAGRQTIRYRNKRFLVLVSYCNLDRPAKPRILGKGRQDQILEAFEKEVSRHGYHCQIQPLVRDRTHQELQPEKIAEFDAVFLLADTLSIEEQNRHVDELWNAKIPFVVTDYFGLSPAHRIQESLSQGVESALNHFESLGHNHVGLLTFDTVANWGEEWPWLKARREAFLHGSIRRNWKNPEQRIWSVPLPKLKKGQYITLLQEAAGEKLVSPFLNHPQPPCAALLAVNDRVAIGFQSKLKRQSTKTCSSISLIGFDNEIAAQSAGLTTVASPAHEMGIGAASMLFDLLNSAPSRNMRCLDYAPLLLRRSTSKPPPSNNSKDTLVRLI